MGHHTGRKGFIYGTAAIQRGNQLLIILSLVCKFCINLVHVAMPNRCSKRQSANRNTLGTWINAEKVSHTIFVLIQNHYCQCPIQGNLCLERAGQLQGHPYAPSVWHLSFSVATDEYIYLNMYFAGISTCFAMGAFISSITSTSVLVHLIYTCGAIHTRITCTFVSIWEIRFEQALF